MVRSDIAPLLVVQDVVVGGAGIVLLPAVARDGLYLGPGDFVDVVFGDEREEIEILGLERDSDPARVRLRVSAAIPLGAGVEVWRSQSQSHVTFKRPPLPPGGVVVSLSGAVSKRGA